MLNLLSGCQFLKNLKQTTQKKKNEAIQKKNIDDKLAFKENLSAEEWKTLVTAVAKTLSNLKKKLIEN
jgi:hypothetical protein